LLRQTRHSILPASPCQYFFSPKKLLRDLFLPTSLRPILISEPPHPVNIFFLLRLFFFRRPEAACAFSGAHLSTKPGPACQYLFSSKRAFFNPRITRSLSPVRKRNVYTKSTFPCQYLCSAFFAETKYYYLFDLESRKSPFSNLNHILFSLVKFGTFIRNLFRVNLYPPLKDGSAAFAV
jgi:hypothetical protein